MLPGWIQRVTKLGPQSMLPRLAQSGKLRVKLERQRGKARQRQAAFPEALAPLALPALSACSPGWQPGLASPRRQRLHPGWLMDPLPAAVKLLRARKPEGASRGELLQAPGVQGAWLLEQPPVELWAAQQPAMPQHRG